MALFSVFLDYLDGRAAAEQHLCKIVCSAARAYEHYILCLLAVYAHKPDKLHHFGSIRGKTYAVAAVQHKAAVGDIDLVSALNNAHKKIRFVTVAHLHKSYAV